LHHALLRLDRERCAVYLVRAVFSHEQDLVVRHAKGLGNKGVSAIGVFRTIQSVELKIQRGTGVQDPISRGVYIAFHKPFGVICTTDPNANNNVIDYINFPSRIFPIGRLDVESSGLMILTNDGDIVNKISKAQNRFEKEYIVTVDQQVTPEALEKMKKGIVMLGQKTLPAKVEKISPHQFTITIIQGLNRQIRRMCEAVHYEVKILKRIRIKNITIDGLGRGKWRHLTPEEVTELLKD